MFANRNLARSPVVELQRVERAVRRRYRLNGDQLVLVREEAARMPGGPAQATTILFWDAAGTRHRLRLFKPAARIAAADLPAGWLRGALRDEGDPDCC